MNYVLMIAKPVLALTLLAVLGLALLSATSGRPKNLGISNGQFAPLPTSPNAVGTQTDQEDKRMPPWSFVDDPEAAFTRLLASIASLPRFTIVKSGDGYAHVEFRSRIFRFVDDAEFWVDPVHKLVHFRAAARAGHSDMGVNRERMTELGRRFQATAK